MKIKKIKEIFKKIFRATNATNADDTTVVGASIARQSAKARPNKKIIAITLPILFLLIAILITITIAAGNNSTPETEQTFTEEGDGYYIWVRAVDHAGNKRTVERGTKGMDRDRKTYNYIKV